MNKKRILIIAGVASVVLLLAGLAGATLVFAQEPTPEPEVPFGWRGGGRGMGGFGGRGMGGFAWAGGGSWTMFDTAAETLGLTPEELFTELHAGKGLDEVAEEQGIEMEAVQDAMNAAQGEAMQQAIEQADWLLEGLEQDFFPMGHGFGFGRGWGRCSCPEGE
ncbi:MAG: hypothetical protein ISS49_08435 [Anaerolineae bacterium]|nr:hypothetical protein [Anaerolineae bacterium]